MTDPIIYTGYPLQVMGLKDQRMKLMNEMLLGIKSIKMYGWESVLKGMIAKARKKEVPTKLLYSLLYSPSHYHSSP